MKTFMIASAVSIAFLSANFFTFLFSYNKLTSGLFTEDQRIENAAMIMSTTLPIYAFIAILFGISLTFALKRNV